MNVPVIDADQVEKSLSMAECIDAMQDLYANESSSMALQPKRIVSHFDVNSVALVMPSFSERLGLFAVKLVTEFKSNPEKYSLPTQGGLTILMDSKNSVILAMLDSAAVTALRTGAVSGLATRYLSRENSREIGSIGSGQQARSMLEAVCSVRKKIRRAKVYSRNRENSQRFAKEMEQKLGITVESVTERSQASKGVDILNVATNSSTPVTSWLEIDTGTHVNSVGTLPDRREMDLETIIKSELFVDTKDGVTTEAGDVLHAINSGRLMASDIKGDLFELVSGSKAGRTDSTTVTLFKSVGFALQDVYASERVFAHLFGTSNRG